MIRKTAKDLWFGVFQREYSVDEPAFFEVGELPAATTIQTHYTAVREALAPLMATDNRDLEAYFDVDLQFPPHNWKTIGFCFWGRKNNANLARFPAVAQLIEQIPGLVTVSFNLLEPRSRILPHYGETNAVHRVHLGIKVPEQYDMCTFTVKEETRPWRDGELLIFLDANTHTAVNDSDERRYILLIDIMRPEFAHLKRRVCVQSLGMLSFYFVLAKLPARPVAYLKANAHRLPRWVLRLAIAPFKLVWSVFWLCRIWGTNH